MHIRKLFHLLGLVAFFQFIVNARCMKFAFVTAQGTSHVFPIDLPVLSNAPSSTIVRIQLGQIVISEIPYKNLSEDFELEIQRTILRTGDNIFHVYYLHNEEVLQEFSFTVSATEEDSLFVSGLKSIYKLGTSRLRLIASRTKQAMLSANKRLIELFKQMLDILSLKYLRDRWPTNAKENVEMVFNQLPTYSDFLRMKEKTRNVYTTQALKQWTKKVIGASVAMLGIGAAVSSLRSMDSSASMESSSMDTP